MIITKEQYINTIVQLSGDATFYKQEVGSPKIEPTSAARIVDEVLANLEIQVCHHNEENLLYLGKPQGKMVYACCKCGKRIER
jgi:hypothetical protein